MLEADLQGKPDVKVQVTRQFAAHHSVFLLELIHLLLNESHKKEPAAQSVFLPLTTQLWRGLNPFAAKSPCARTSKL